MTASLPGAMAGFLIYFYKKNNTAYDNLLEKVVNKNGKNITELLKNECISKSNNNDMIINDYNILFNEINELNNFILKEEGYYKPLTIESSFNIKKEVVLNFLNINMLQKNWFTISLKDPKKIYCDLSNKLFMYDTVSKRYILCR